MVESELTPGGGVEPISIPGVTVGYGVPDNESIVAKPISKESQNYANYVYDLDEFTETHLTVRVEDPPSVNFRVYWDNNELIRVDKSTYFEWSDSQNRSIDPPPYDGYEIMIYNTSGAQDGMRFYWQLDLIP